MTDRNNCGACGVSCDDYGPIGMVGQCVQGKCDFQCMIAVEDPIQNLKNCNGILDDGCEVDVYSDPMNCGVCGNKCNAGDDCIEGRCGCPPGFTKCGSRCVDLKTNDLNCGECGHQCPYMPEDGPFAFCEITDKHAQGKCLNGTCGNLSCYLGWGDCDNDMSKCPTNPNGAWSGCETPVTTMENCGACGNTCAPGQVCARVSMTEIRCVDTCDKQGLTDCGTAGEYGGGCRDLNNDKHYCGSCVNDCPNAGPHQTVVCNKGSCEYPCDVGWADCNGNLADGCEVNTMVNPSNCGACGVTCDSVVGQPCIEGTVPHEGLRRTEGCCRDEALAPAARARSLVRPSPRAGLGRRLHRRLHELRDERRDPPGAEDGGVIAERSGCARQTQDAPTRRATRPTRRACCPSPIARQVDWCTVDSGVRSSERLNSVWGSSKSDVWAVGSRGSVVHYDGAAWKSLPLGNKSTFFAVWGSGPNDVWAVSDTMTIMHSDGYKDGRYRVDALSRRSASRRTSRPRPR